MSQKEEDNDPLFQTNGISTFTWVHLDGSTENVSVGKDVTELTDKMNRDIIKDFSENSPDPVGALKKLINPGDNV